MKLLTKALLKRFSQVGTQSEDSNPIVLCKFFNPCGAGTWYATEFNPDDGCFFGYVTGLGYDEWGYFSLYELTSVKCPPFGLPIERDLHFNEQRFKSLSLD